MLNIASEGKNLYNLEISEENMINNNEGALTKILRNHIKEVIISDKSDDWSQLWIEKEDSMVQDLILLIS